jgi:hypothetical protein
MGVGSRDEEGEGSTEKWLRHDDDPSIARFVEFAGSSYGLLGEVIIFTTSNRHL